MQKVIAQGATQNILRQDPVRGKFSTVGELVSAVLPYVYTAAGLAMLVMLIFGGIELMTSGGDPGKIKSGYGKITSALIGFFLVFLSFAIVQLLQTAFGFKIL